MAHPRAVVLQLFVLQKVSGRSRCTPCVLALLVHFFMVRYTQFTCFSSTNADTGGAAENRHVTPEELVQLCLWGKEKKKKSLSLLYWLPRLGMRSCRTNSAV